jgi:hippurate hydrolase
VTIDFQYHDGYPPTVNSLTEAELCRDVAASVVGREAVDWALPPSMGAEDFAYFLEKRSGCYVWLGNGAGSGEHGACLLHNARYDFNDEVIPLGVTYWVKLVERCLATSAA